ncbi:hypothetical protein [Aliarcobacter cryaerophilus]|uniref:hypothetical protein n=1 Tax=Aliarcobacter cryaerophilus TaxID=28198 RepID=UPI0021B5C32E|nr:hypothetical protein [Aliarcobacter cryaerophilus]MCT7405190.1 hypothetical protein [Aliarcobacter cryaerophilus]MCT7461190.1 hypothetical protein [Aliarcobacter cryaerophilus]MCT7502769.1 hypothetical protein [Aliarcobacter cryaerophilus]
MQYFGEIQTKYEEVFLTQSYMYFKKDEDENISAKDLKNLIKTKDDRKKNIIGTVFIYNPVVTPIGFDSNKFLLEQDFKAFDELIELKCEGYITIFKQAMKDSCKGKIVEIKNLFNLIEGHIDSSTLLSKFNEDLEKYNSNQNTEFDRDIMYLDAQNYLPFGKFVYFCWGDKINPKEFSNISDYARTIYENCVKSGKKVAFAYKKEKTADESIKYLQFSNPMQNHKNKNSISFAIKRSFDTFPPTPAFYE